MRSLVTPGAVAPPLSSPAFHGFTQTGPPPTTVAVAGGPRPTPRARSPWRVRQRTRRPVQRCPDDQSCVPPSSCQTWRSDLPLRLVPVTITKLPFEHLAERIDLEFVDELDRAWTLVARETLAAVREEVLGGHRLGCDDDREDRLAPLLVGNADHRGFGHAGVRREHALDL